MQQRFIKLTTPLLFICLTLQCNATLTPITIESDVMKLIDGNPSLKAADFIELQDGIQRLRTGQNNALGQDNLISYNGKRFTFKQMVDFEKGGLLVEKGQLKKSAANALAEVHKKIDEVTKKYMRKARIFKSTLVKIIDQWSKQRKFPNTVLKQWSRQGDGHEIKQLAKLAGSFISTDGFLNHLSLFLIDLRNSCPKTFKKT